MDPIFLTFNSRSLERDYDAHVARCSALTTDLVALRLMLLVPGAAFLKSVKERDSFYFGAGAFLVAFYAVCILILRRRANQQELIERRTRHTVVNRFVVLGMHLCGSLFDSSMATNLVGFTQRSGIAMSILISTGLSLKFKHHLPFNAISTFLILFLTSRFTCTTILNANHHHGINSIGHILDFIVRRTLFTMGIEIRESNLECPCLHVTVWMHVFVILCGLSGLFWVKERNARVAFVKSVSEKHLEQLECHENLRSMRALPCWIVTMHLGMLTTLFAVTWVWSYPLVRLLQKYGLVVA